MPIRYAIRQALDQEYQKFQIQRGREIREARYKAGSVDNALGSDEEMTPHDYPSDVRNGDSDAKPMKNEASSAPKRDFFGRVVNIPCSPSAMNGEQDEQSHQSISKSESGTDHALVWVSFNEGFSNAVRKPLTLFELLQDF